MKIENEAIPENWEVIKFKNNVGLLGGYPFDSKKFNEDGIGLPLIRIRNILKGYSETFFNGEYLKDYLIEKNDILVGMDGDFHISRWQGNKALLNQRILKLYQIPNSQINLDFFYYLAQPFLDRVHFRTAGTTVKHLSNKDFYNAKFKLPPLPEQQKIAEILSTVDEKIAVIDQQITATEELKKGLMQRLLTKGIGHTEFKDSPLGEIPKSWEVRKLEEIAEIKGGKRLPKGKSLIETKNSHPYIRVADMKMGGVDISNILYVPDDVFPSIARYIINKGDLFITVAGTLGLVGEIPEGLDGANLTENADKITNIKVDKHFLLYVLLSPIIQNAVEREQTNNAQPKLALTRIRTFKVPVPPQVEQQKIAGSLKCVFEKIENQKDKKQAYLQLKKGLMQQLLTGKVRVNQLLEA
ncbi:type I restriction enzyme S subunit [Mesonia algae]|uniref:Type I restriction enzyme S subunit n=1 Tax=Mesonia algae TaxID=213248 RepID=A0A2W7I105_9FLAO|nr:restriction endonuclease subunit S [Mesonia algae]PZW40466.1 type I restriction enzyme S subunit [Mesonia algae]